MNINSIRKQLYSLLNCDCSFHYCGMRGQSDAFVGRIVKIYPRVFLIEVKNHSMKCFSYSDFATRLLKIM